jgi:hypothetical protein
LTGVFALCTRSSLPLRLATVAAGAAFLTFAATPHAARWSPYYLVQHTADRSVCACG